MHKPFEYNSIYFIIESSNPRIELTFIFLWGIWLCTLLYVLHASNIVGDISIYQSSNPLPGQLIYSQAG